MKVEEQSTAKRKIVQVKWVYILLLIVVVAICTETYTEGRRVKMSVRFLSLSLLRSRVRVIERQSGLLSICAEPRLGPAAAAAFDANRSAYI